jgi:hypothetical protein
MTPKTITERGATQGLTTPPRHTKKEEENKREKLH